MLNKKIIHTVFEQEAQRLPTRTAIEEGSRQTSYQDLNCRANRLAHLLRSLGVEREEAVGVMLSPGTELVTALLAVFKSAGIYLPIDRHFSRKRLEQLFKECNPKVVIVDEVAAQMAAGLAVKWQTATRHLVVVSEGKVEVLTRQGPVFGPAPRAFDSFPEESPELISDPNDGNYIFYTSGSTGSGKAILGCHKSLSHFIHWEKTELALDETVRVSQLLHFTFDASLRDILLPLCVGGTLCIPEPACRTNLRALAEWLEQDRITLVHSVPSLFRLLTAELPAAAAPRLPALQYVLLAGEPLYTRDILNWRQAVGGHAEIVNLYGPTETTLVKTFHRIKQLSPSPSQPISAGKPISNTVVAILDKDTLCPAGEIGEIYIKTPFTTKGYYHNEELTRQVFVQNPLVNDKADIIYRTGDLGRYSEEGELEILGRLDDQVKINGIRVELGEVIQAVAGVEGVRQAEIIVHRDGNRPAELVCYYTGEEKPGETLRHILRETLNENILPAYFLYLAEMPLTLNGKVDRKALPRPEALLFRSVEYQPPQNQLEQELEQLWKQALNLSRVGRNTSFFRIGGTSLKAIQVISSVFKKYNVLLRISDVFANPTIAQLAELIPRQRQTAYQQIEPVQRQDHYPVSLAQRRVWIGEQFVSNQIAYNMPAGYLLEGELDIGALYGSFRTLVERHESIRTVFTVVEGEPRQRVLEAADYPFRLDYLDLAGAVDSREKARRAADAEVNAPFDLETGPLLRVKLIRTAAAEYILLLNMHHIVSDGWSMEVLVHEILALYQAYRAEKPNPLPPLRIQYKDYSAWQLQQGNSDRLREARQYWLEELGEEVPALELPTDFPRPALQTFNGATLTFEVEQATVARLKEMGKQQEATLFVVLLAAVNALLYRYCGQKDIIVGTPVAGREHKDLADQIGFYINLLPLRTRFSPEASFANLLRTVKQKAVAAYQHQAYPFIELVDDLKIDIPLDRNVLFDVVVQMQDVELKNGMKKDMPGIRVNPYSLNYKGSKFDLTFNFVETDTLTVDIEYNTDLFADDTIAGMKDALLELFRIVISCSATTVKELKQLLRASEGTVTGQVTSPAASSTAAVS